MNPAESLPLRDIHLPPPVSWWPPAPGWWLLLVMVILGCLGLWLLIRKLRQPVLKKSAKAEIQWVISQYQQHQEKQLFIQQLSMAIRRIAMSYISRREMAGLTGTDWLHRLNTLVSSHQLSEQTMQLLSQLPYQKNPHISDQQITLLMDQLQAWVSALSRGKQYV